MALNQAFNGRCRTVDNYKPDHEDVDLDPIQIANSNTRATGLTL